MPKERIRLRKPRVRLTKPRVRLTKKLVRPWKPKWEPEIRGWALNYIRTNKWRYESIHEIDDLMQDAYMVFLKVTDAYPRVVEPRHFMSLFKTSLSNFLTDKAREYDRKLGLIKEDEYLDLTTEPASVDQSLSTTYNEGPFLALLQNSPPEVKMLLAFLQDDVNLAKLREPQRTAKGQPRLNLNQRLCKLLGISDFQFKEAFKQLLT